MAITNPAAIAFSDQYVRKMADQMAKRYFQAKAIVAVWNAQSLSSLFPNDSTTVTDSAATDGRPVITGAMVNNVITRAQEIIADYEATSNAKLNTVLAVAVNPQP